MRAALIATGVQASSQDSHPGLWWTRVAPIPDEGGDSISAEAKDGLIEAVCKIPVPEFYPRAFASWHAAIRARAYTWELELTSRLLVGHGEPSAIGVGITLHPTYGVPYIPGSAIKGVLSHHLGLSGDDWKGVGYRTSRGEARVLGDGQPVAAPGPWSRVLFGAPPTLDAPKEDARGVVEFEDAWLVPTPGTVLVRDVLTPHQKSYYDSSGKAAPIDWDDPNPVAYVTARPGLSFLFALSFAPTASGWAELAFRHLADALGEGGIGGKTSVGYGRFRPADGATEAVPPRAAPVRARVRRGPASAAFEMFSNAVQAVAKAVEGKVAVFKAQDFVALAAAVPADERAAAWAMFKPLAQHPKLARREPEVIVAVRERLNV